jgi:hypothetical protein
MSAGPNEFPLSGILGIPGKRGQRHRVRNVVKGRGECGPYLMIFLMKSQIDSSIIWTRNHEDAKKSLSLLNRKRSERVKPDRKRSGKVKHVLALNSSYQR